MPAPVFDVRTSILVAALGRDFHYQPAVAADSDPATEWECAGLPADMLCDAETGEIHGAPSEGGVFNIALMASNASGFTTLNFTMGVEDRDFQIADDSSIEVDIDIRTGYVSVPGVQPGKPTPAKGIRPEIPGAILFAKFGDRKVLAVAFKKDGIAQEVDINRAAVAIKEFEPDLVLVEGDGTWLQVGTGEATRYLIALDFEGSRLRAALENYVSDDGTHFPALAEIEFHANHDGEYRPQTSQSFRWHVERDWIREPVSSSSSEPESSSSSEPSSSSSSSSEPPSSESSSSSESTYSYDPPSSEPPSESSTSSSSI